MSVAEETISPKEASKRKSVPVMNRILDILSSVRLGVVLLCILVVLSMIGMLIVQQNVDGFDAYFVSLTPAEKTVYGALGFFDIYHSLYYNALLLWLSLNIVLASIDRFPSAWSYIADPMKSPTRGWLLSQKFSKTIELSAKNEAEAGEKAANLLRTVGFTPLTTESSKLEYGVDEHGNKDFSVMKDRSSLVVFGEKGRINRLGAYIVHVFLLTLFLGHFVALQTGFDADVRMVPGQVTDQIQLIQFNLDKKEKFNVQLPFTMECTDIQQTLIDPSGNISVTNTLDWRTQLKIDDPQYGTKIIDVSLNKPFSYRGYRFFQAQTVPLGAARNITLELTPQNGAEIVKLDIPRGGSATLADGTKVDFREFQPDFTFGPDGKPATKTGEYNNPVAVLNVTPTGGEPARVFAFAQKLADNMPVGAPKAGYKWRLAEFEKSPSAHILSIKYDPFDAAFIAWYIGGFGLMGALIFVFFYSHRRIWVRIEKLEGGNYEAVIAGDTNRNPFGFEDRFNKIADGLTPVKNQG
ncbi:MAG: cytochrome c biogenesis protein ResB [Acidobacteria bacterium]|nr:cytochrome c biogenesis protein ResB [Acidobacteriota bacterium]